jgi:hypothetical protein
LGGGGDFPLQSHHAHGVRHEREPGLLRPVLAVHQHAPRQTQLRPQALHARRTHCLRRIRRNRRVHVTVVTPARGVRLAAIQYHEVDAVAELVHQLRHLGNPQALQKMHWQEMEPVSRTRGLSA